MRYPIREYQTDASSRFWFSALPDPRGITYDRKAFGIRCETVTSYQNFSVKSIANGVSALPFAFSPTSR
jgi:hypothetical protein